MIATKESILRSSPTAKAAKDRADPSSSSSGSSDSDLDKHMKSSPAPFKKQKLDGPTNLGSSEVTPRDNASSSSMSSSVSSSSSDNDKHVESTPVPIRKHTINGAHEIAPIAAEKAEKISTGSTVIAAPDTLPSIKYQDISAEVDARLQAKTDRASFKKDSNKRKRQSMESNASTNGQTVARSTVNTAERPKPKKPRVEEKPTPAKSGSAITVQSTPNKAVKTMPPPPKPAGGSLPTPTSHGDGQSKKKAKKRRKSGSGEPQVAETQTGQMSHKKAKISHTH